MTVTETEPVAGRPVALVENILLARIRESKENPRRTFSDLDDLADDIRRRGILQPLLVRPLAVNAAAGEMLQNFELVFGARRLRAAALAGLDVVPCMIRQMTDDEALEARIVENSKREDVHPIEEASGYDWLHNRYGLTVGEIAHKVGKSPSWVYGRLKLLGLCKEARSAFLDGNIEPSVAVLIARIPSDELQRQLLEDVAGDEYQRPTPFKEVSQVIRDNYMTRLKGAPFQTDDPTLVPEAGACTNCPHRTGNNPDLFEDVDKDDVCTNPECYAQKRDAAIAMKLNGLKANGIEVMPEKKAKQVFNPYGGDLRYGCGYVDLAKPCEFDDAKHKRSYKRLLRDVDLPIVAAVDPGTHKVRELAKAEDVKKALKEAGIKVGAGAGVGASINAPAAKREKSKAEIQREFDEKVTGRIAELTLEAVVAEAEKSNSQAAEFWLICARLAVKRAWHDALRTVVKRRGIEKNAEETPQEALVRHVGTLSAGEARGLMLEVLLSVDHVGFEGEPDYPETTKLVTLYAIDTDPLVTRAHSELAKDAPKSRNKSKGRKAKADTALDVPPVAA